MLTLRNHARCRLPWRLCLGRFLLSIACFVLLGLTGCSTLSPHRFIQPAADWHVRTGQLMYRSPRSTLVGEVLIRYSRTGDFELTFSKGPGITLLTLRQDNVSAQARGALARTGWSGPVDRAPKQLRGWLELRQQILSAPERRSIRQVSGDETFLLRF